MATVGRNRSTLQKMLLTCGMLVILLVLSFPLYYMLITSLKTPGEAFRLPPTLWPAHPTIDSYAFMLRAWSYWQTLMTTILVAGVSSLGATILGGMAAYGFSRLRFIGKPLLYSFMIGSMAIPGMVTLGPIFLAYRALQLIDTRFGLILVFMAGGLPVAFLTLFSYLKSIPRDLDDAASMDGCSRLGTLFRIIVPIAMPGIAVSFLLLFIAGWNEFLFAFTLTATPTARLLTVRLFEVPVRADVNTIPYDLIAAGGILILLPLLPVLLSVQKQLVQGIMAGAVKE